jgi:hypothetical protein
VNSGEASVYAERNQAERAFEQIVGNSPALESVLEQVERVAPTDATILIQGETELRAKRAPPAEFFAWQVVQRLDAYRCDKPKESIYESVHVSR